MERLVQFLDEQIRQADAVIEATRKVTAGWDIDKAISQGKKQVELLKAGYKPSQILEMTKEV